MTDTRHKLAGGSLTCTPAGNSGNCRRNRESEDYNLRITVCPPKGWALHVLFVALCLLALAWTAQSVRIGLHKGPDADVYRQWVVAQYVRQRIDPYRVHREVLQHTYGEASGPNRIKLSKVKIYGITNTTWDPSQTTVLPAYGPPEATYPPFAVLLFAFAIGFIPVKLLHPIWVVVNLVAVSLLAVSLVRGRGSWSSRYYASVMIALTVCLLWPPTQQTVRAGQFSLLVVLFLVRAVRTMSEGSEIRDGVWFILALIKPSLSLPFLILPLIQRRWKTLAIIFGLNLGATLSLSTIVWSSPMSLVANWLAGSQYYLQGMYSLQEVLNRFEIENTENGVALLLGFLIAVWVLAGAGGFVARPPADTFMFLGLASLMCMYHGFYDFVVLLPPLLATVESLGSAVDKPFGRHRGRLLQIAWGVAFVVLGMALTEFVSGSSSPVTRGIRWAGRATLLWMFAALALRMARRWWANDVEERT